MIEIWDHPPRRSSAKGFAQIGFDHDAVGRAMARHLLDQGHTSLAHVDSGMAEDFRAHERGEGFANEARTARARVVTVRAEIGRAAAAAARQAITAKARLPSCALAWELTARASTLAGR